MAEHEGAGREAQFHQLNKPDAPKEAAVHRELDLNTARAILQTIVNTPESTITATTPLDRVGGYSVEQVRDAERMLARDIIEKQPVPSIHGALSFTDKSTSQGDARLYFAETSVIFSLMKSGGEEYYYKNIYPLQEPAKVDQWQFGFEDWRPGGTMVSLEDVQDPSLSAAERLQRIHTIWRGIRWMNANMLNWDKPDAILPEQLDTAPASSPQDKPQR